MTADIETIETDDLVEELGRRFEISVFIGKRPTAEGRTFTRFRSVGDGHACIGLALDAASRLLGILHRYERPPAPNEPGV